jgi:hypothetical protein
MIVQASSCPICPYSRSPRTWRDASWGPLGCCRCSERSVRAAVRSDGRADAGRAHCGAAESKPGSGTGGTERAKAARRSREGAGQGRVQRAWPAIRVGRAARGRLEGLPQDARARGSGARDDEAPRTREETASRSPSPGDHRGDCAGRHRPTLAAGPSLQHELAPAGRSGPPGS